MKATDPGVSAPAFALQINAATRKEHNKLNKLILARLPRCLPPIASDPASYATGIRLFAPIFSTFEQEWRAILSLLSERSQLAGEVKDDSPSNLGNLLAIFYESKLCRSERIQSDLATLASRSARPLGDRKNEREQAHLIEQRCCATVHSISFSIRAKPHILLAYSWVMYMALFNGGRWIRQQLLNAGPSFWRADANGISDRDFGVLSFWFFDPSSAADGEELKTTFKLHFEEISSQLTESERSDIIAEAVRLFNMCIDLVYFLDGIMLPASLRASIPLQSNGAAEGVATPIPSSPRMRTNSSKDAEIVTIPPPKKAASTAPRLFSTFNILAAGLLLLAIWLLAPGSPGADAVFRSTSSILSRNW